MSENEYAQKLRELKEKIERLTPLALELLKVKLAA